MTIISRAAYAQHCGISAQAIDKAIKRGDLPLNEQGLIEFEYAEATYGRRREERAAMRATTLDIERRRDRATLQSAIARALITQRQVDRLRSRLVERDKARAALASLIARLDTLLPTLTEKTHPRDAALLADAEALIADDLGDLQSEMLKVMQPDER